MEKLVSIIVPAFNVEEYIEECIESLLKQTYKNIEIIIVDDGSTDSTPVILKKYTNNKKIKIIRQKNMGLSAARNAGLDLANGYFLSFIDSDDFIDKRFIEKLVMNIKNADICVCDYFDYYDSAEFYSYHSPFLLNGIYPSLKYWDLSKSLTGCNSMIACNKLYKYSLFDKVRYEVGRYHEDEFILHKLIDKSKFISFLPEKLYFYRNRIGSITTTINENKIIDTCDALKSRINYFIKKEFYTPLDSCLYAFLLSISNLKLSNSYYSEQKKYLRSIPVEFLSTKIKFLIGLACFNFFLLKSYFWTRNTFLNIKNKSLLTLFAFLKFVFFKLFFSNFYLSTNKQKKQGLKHTIEIDKQFVKCIKHKNNKILNFYFPTINNLEDLLSNEYLFKTINVFPYSNIYVHLNPDILLNMNPLIHSLLLNIKSIHKGRIIITTND